MSAIESEEMIPPPGVGPIGISVKARLNNQVRRLVLQRIDHDAVKEPSPETYFAGSGHFDILCAWVRSHFHVQNFTLHFASTSGSWSSLGTEYGRRIDSQKTLEDCVKDVIQDEENESSQVIVRLCIKTDQVPSVDALALSVNSLPTSPIGEVSASSAAGSGGNAKDYATSPSNRYPRGRSVSYTNVTRSRAQTVGEGKREISPSVVPKVLSALNQLMKVQFAEAERNRHVANELCKSLSASAALIASHAKKSESEANMLQSMQESLKKTVQQHQEAHAGMDGHGVGARAGPSDKGDDNLIIAALREQVAVLQSQLESAKKKIHQQNAEHEMEMRAAREREKATTERLEQQVKNLLQMKRDAEDQQSENVATAAEMESKHIKIQELEMKLENAEEKNRAMQAQLEHLEVEMETMTGKHNNLVEAMSSRIRELKKKSVMSAAQVKELTAAHGDARDALEAAETAVKKGEEKMYMLQARNEALSSELVEVKSLVEGIKLENEKLTQDNTNLNKEVMNLRETMQRRVPITQSIDMLQKSFHAELLAVKEKLAQYEHVDGLSPPPAEGRSSSGMDARAHLESPPPSSKPGKDSSAARQLEEAENLRKLEKLMGEKQLREAREQELAHMRELEKQKEILRMHNVGSGNQRSPTRPVDPPPSKPAAEWQCTACTLLNANAATHCSLCGFARPPSS